MPPHADPPPPLTGRARRNARLREQSLSRAAGAPPLARTLVHLRAAVLGMTRLEFARRSGVSRGTLRDLELGVHAPTRNTLRQLLTFYQRCRVPAELIEEVRRLYAGPGDTLTELIGRLELLAGSPRELARRVGISAATLWEYRRGNFPLPLDLLRKMCAAAGECADRAEALWHEAERQRFLDRGFPPALAEFWVLCHRQGYAEKHLAGLGLGTAALRRLRYLELPPWAEVAGAARALCRDGGELSRLQKLWEEEERDQPGRLPDPFGARIQQLRKKQGVSRRELADLFGVGGKKPARIIKHVEEDGFYSAQAFPAGLAAVLAEEDSARARLRKVWQARREQFHHRHRPEMRLDLRLAREWYGLGLADMEEVLGYSRLEYQRLERGVGPLLETARARIREAIELAGVRKVEALLQRRREREAARLAWRAPTSVPALVELLARREGGLVPLARLLRKAGQRCFWPARLRAIAAGSDVPAWPVVERLATACGVDDLYEVR